MRENCLLMLLYRFLSLLRFGAHRGNVHTLSHGTDDSEGNTTGTYKQTSHDHLQKPTPRDVEENISLAHFEYNPHQTPLVNGRFQDQLFDESDFGTRKQGTTVSIEDVDQGRSVADQVLLGESNLKDNLCTAEVANANRQEYLPLQINYNAGIFSIARANSTIVFNKHNMHKNTVGNSIIIQVPIGTPGRESDYSTKVTGGINCNGIITIRAEKTVTGESTSTFTSKQQGLEENELTLIREELKKFQEIEGMKRARNVAKNNLEDYAYRLKQAVEDECDGKKISEEDKVRIMGQCEEVLVFIDEKDEHPGSSDKTDFELKLNHMRDTFHEYINMLQ